MRARRRRLAAGLCAAGALVVLDAGPAAADPAGPSDYRSTITAVEPAVDGVTIEVVGGDAFLRVEADEGHEVEIPGYEGEPYLRIGADGTVEQNATSPTTYLNEDRYGDVDVSAFDADAPPQWEMIDDDGEIAWHDHRIHWMAPTRRPGAVEGEEILAWSVPLVVDGDDVTVEGSLVLEEGVPVLPWIGLGLVLAAAALALGWARARSLPVAAAAALVAALGASVAGWVEWQSQPEGVGASPAGAIVPIVGLVAVVVGAPFLHRRPALASIGTLAAAAAVLGWAVLRFDVLTHPVLPTELSAGADRGLTVAALGLGVAAATLAVRSGALAVAPAALSDD